jgi:hypothetical protein
MRSKAFFFEKKKQTLLSPLCQDDTRPDGTATPGDKSFLVLFLEKECLPSRKTLSINQETLAFPNDA